MSEPRPQLDPAGELPPLRPADSANDSLPKFSGKYVAIALFVGALQFYWTFPEHLSIRFDWLIVALAQGGSLTIAAVALYGRSKGKEFFREPGHWLASIVALECIGGWISDFMLREWNDRSLWFMFLLLLYYSYTIAKVILGVVLIKFYVDGKVFDTWPWRAVALLMGLRVIGMAWLVLWVEPRFIGIADLTADKRIRIIELLAGAAACIALASDARTGKRHHWTHTAGVCCWLGGYLARKYWTLLR